MNNNPEKLIAEDILSELHRIKTTPFPRQKSRARIFAKNNVDLLINTKIKAANAATEHISRKGVDLPDDIVKSYRCKNTYDSIRQVLYYIVTTTDINFIKKSRQWLFDKIDLLYRNSNA